MLCYPFNHLLQSIHAHTCTLTLCTCNPPPSKCLKNPLTHITCTNHRIKPTQAHNVSWTCTPPDTQSPLFFLSPLFQPLPFIITQPEAQQCSVWLRFSTSYSRCTAIYHSAHCYHCYQLPSPSLLPGRLHFKGLIKAVPSGGPFTWDKDFYFDVFTYKQQPTTEITV